jgi:hypothetical protein
MVPSSVICIRLFGLLSGVAAQFFGAKTTSTEDSRFCC